MNSRPGLGPMLLLAMCASSLLFSCKTPNYFPLPVNQLATANKGEVQAIAGVGTSGGVIRGGVALSDRWVVAGQYNGPLAGEYRSREGEFALGYNTKRNEKGHVATLFGGYGMGSNYWLDSGATMRDYYGDFQRGFVQFGMGSTLGKLGNKVKAGTNFGFKLNYINYKGAKAASSGYTPFTASNYFLDFYMGANIGGKHWRLELGEGFSMKTDLKAVNQPSHNLRIFPATFNLSLHIIIGRDYDRAAEDTPLPESKD